MELTKYKSNGAIMHIQLGPIDYAILVIYFVFVIGIGWILKRYMKGSADFFLSGRSIPAWVTGLAFISANLGYGDGACAFRPLVETGPAPVGIIRSYLC